MGVINPLLLSVLSPTFPICQFKLLQNWLAFLICVFFSPDWHPSIYEDGCRKLTGTHMDVLLSILYCQSCCYEEVTSDKIGNIHGLRFELLQHLLLHHALSSSLEEYLVEQILKVENGVFVYNEQTLTLLAHAVICRAVLCHMIYYPHACPSSLLLVLRSKLRDAQLTGVRLPNTGNDHLSPWALLAVENLMRGWIRDGPISSNMLNQLIDIAPLPASVCQDEMVIGCLSLSWGDLCATFSRILGHWRGKVAETVDDLVIERYVFVLCWDVPIMGSTFEHLLHFWSGKHTMDTSNVEHLFCFSHLLLGHCGVIAENVNFSEMVFAVLQHLHAVNLSGDSGELGLDFLRNGSWPSLVLSLLNAGIWRYCSKNSITFSGPVWSDQTSRDNELLSIAEGLVSRVFGANQVAELMSSLRRKEGINPSQLESVYDLLSKLDAYRSLIEHLEVPDYSCLYELKHMEEFLRLINLKEVSNSSIHEWIVNKAIDFMDILRKDPSRAVVFRFSLSGEDVSAQVKDLYGSQRGDLFVLMDSLILYQEIHVLVSNKKYRRNTTGMDLLFLSQWLERRLLGSMVADSGGIACVKVSSVSLRESTMDFIVCLVSPFSEQRSGELQSHVFEAMLVSLDNAFLLFDAQTTKSYFSFVAQLSRGETSMKALLQRCLVLMKRLAGDEHQLQGLKFLFGFLGAILSDCGLNKSTIDKSFGKSLSSNSSGMGIMASRSPSSGKNSETLVLSADQEGGSASLECDATSADEDEDDGTSDGEVGSMDKDEEDDSDSDRALGSKVCTFTSSGSNFMEQHWYFCYTCNLTVSKGCCSVSAKVCHRGHHDVYSRSSRFFCDCGAGGVRGSSCQCWKPRKFNASNNAPTRGSANFQSFLPFTEDGDQLPDSDSDFDEDVPMDNDNSIRLSIPREVQDTMPLILKELEVESQVLELCSSFLPSVTCRRDSNLSKGKTIILGEDKVLSYGVDLLQLRKAYKNRVSTFFFVCSQSKPPLSLSTSSSSAPPALIGVQLQATQSFDGQRSGSTNLQRRQLWQRKDQTTNPAKKASTVGNSVTLAKIKADYPNAKELKSHFAGGSLVKSLLSVSIRGQLAVGEGYKVAIFDVGQLIGQATVAPVTAGKANVKPLSKNVVRFEIVHLVFNPVVENYLAVAGYEDCQVHTVSHRGEVTDRVAIELALQGSYIRHVDWVPGSQVQLMVVTNQFVKIYDLSQHNISPMQYFTLPDDMIVDATLVVATQGRMFLIVLSELGCLFRLQLSMKGNVSNCSTLVGRLNPDGSFLTEISAIYEDEHDGKLRPAGLHRWRELLVGSGLFVCFSTLRSKVALAVSLGENEMFAQNLRHSMGSTLPLVGITAYKPLSKDKIHCLVLHDDCRLQIYSHVPVGVDASSAALSEKVKRLGSGILSNKAYAGLNPEFPLDFFEKTVCITADVKLSGDAIRKGDSDGAKQSLVSEDGFLESPPLQDLRYCCCLV
ncbi:hypothetical protein RHSIM_Rhsim05G0129500 [Rhododendron simsii]|uniref:UBR-type domain-containing protein n=1 Tax=Rhododendron simsii TaxID=118357 RepID=A0A834GZC5_RHOSS|nr:hypothetical protein RHSIM_Rhsim05G0129500 [Rhododendron simsii]